MTIFFISGITEDISLHIVRNNLSKIMINNDATSTQKNDIMNWSSSPMHTQLPYRKKTSIGINVRGIRDCQNREC